MNLSLHEGEFGLKVSKEILDDWEEQMQIKVECLFGEGIVNMYECNNILVDPSLIDHDEFFKNYTYERSVIVVLPLLEEYSKDE